MPFGFARARNNRLARLLRDALTSLAETAKSLSLYLRYQARIVRQYDRASKERRPEQGTGIPRPRATTTNAYSFLALRVSFGIAFGMGVRGIICPRIAVLYTKAAMIAEACITSPGCTRS
jgi:hypothetical protein